MGEPEGTLIEEMEAEPDNYRWRRIRLSEFAQAPAKTREPARFTRPGGEIR